MAKLMTTRPPPEKPDALVVDMQRCLPVQLLTSLLRLGGGWVARAFLGILAIERKTG